MATCTVCANSACAAIEGQLAAGVSTRKVARAFGLKKDAVHGHFRRCMARKPDEPANVAPSESVAWLQRNIRDTERIMDRAKQKGDYKVQLECLKRLEDFRAKLHAVPTRGNRGGVCACANPRLRICFDNVLAPAGSPSVTLPELLAYAIDNLDSDFETVLEELLMGVVPNPKLSAAKREAIVEFLERWEAASAAERNNDVRPSEELARRQD